ncbi:hypothetical protein [Streptomyces camelliae]|uniref:Transposase n=1 Tax=Streptomyces camelliae TaxID=3004093 RepID=A0ABY7NWH8_9ACTN|nr:hypothetical protein [Streptomyces sp. HUAS 2-6]WBO61453.1 hypothetical protein O1G22_00415 [Streptomyces sp. HUAS 2-6]
MRAQAGIESTYLALKFTQHGAGRVVRSHSPRGVEQEIGAYLTAYQLLRVLQG